MSSKPSCKHILFRFYIFLGGLLGLAALAVSLAAFARPYWLVYKVDSALVPQNDGSVAWYSRFRGLLNVCLKDKQAPVLKHTINKDYTSEDGCLRLDLGQQSPNSTDDNYWYIINLRRSCIGVYSAVMIFGLISLVAMMVGIIFWCSPSITAKHLSCIRLLTGWMFELSGGSLIAAIILFHLYIDYEKTLTTNGLLSIYRKWSTSLRTATTTIKLGNAYYFAWGAVVGWIVGGIVMIHSALLRGPDHHRRGDGRHHQRFSESMIACPGSREQSSYKPTGADDGAADDGAASKRSSQAPTPRDDDKAKRKNDKKSNYDNSAYDIPMEDKSPDSGYTAHF